MLKFELLNGHNNMYVLIFGSDKYNPMGHLKHVKSWHQYSTLPEARKAAREYDNAYIFKVHYIDGDDEPMVSEVLSH